MKNLLLNRIKRMMRLSSVYLPGGSSAVQGLQDMRRQSIMGGDTTDGANAFYSGVNEAIGADNDTTSNDFASGNEDYTSTEQPSEWE